MSYEPSTEMVQVRDGRRLSKQEAAMLRLMQADGVLVRFADRHQWRHFQRHP